MSSSIHINPKLLREVASNLQSTVEALNVVNNAMKKVHNEMPSAWQSGYTDMYLEKMEEVRAKVKATQIEVENIQAGLRNTAQRVETLEKQQTQILTSGSSGGGGGR